MAEERFAALTEREYKIARSLREKKYRDLHGAFLIEGIRLCEEALAARQAIRRVLVTPTAVTHERIGRLIRACAQMGVLIAMLPEAKYRALSDEPTPAGIAMVVEKSAPTSVNPAPLILAIDALHDPGNLGAVLRSADWFGVRELLLGQGCVDLYNPKTVRAAMGSLFHLNIEKDAALAERLKELARQGYRIIASSANAAYDLPTVTPGSRDLLLIGSEAHGIAPELLRSADLVVKIPKRGGGESLNAAVAAAVMLYHFQFGTAHVDA